MGRQKLVSVLAVFVMILAMSGMASAAVPDRLEISEQPETIDADGESCIDVTAQLLADYNGATEPVKMCGVHVICESQNSNILSAKNTGAATAEGFTDEFGEAKMEFCSTGSEEYNIGDVEVVCRALQLEEDSSWVHVLRERETRIAATMCPQSGWDDLDSAIKALFSVNPEFVEADAQADILADGESKLYVTGQLKNDETTENECGDVPVKNDGKMRFKSLNTNIVKTCDVPGVYQNRLGQTMTIVDDGTIIVDAVDGVAEAEFCSAGRGSENVGDATIVIESVDFLNVDLTQITVTTTSQYGTTYKLGYLAMSAMPHQILADGVTEFDVCAQLRDQDYRIVKKLNELVSLESDDTNIIEAVNPASSTDAGIVYVYTNSDGIAFGRYISAGTFDSLNVGFADIFGTTLWLIGDKPSVQVETKTTQIWPVNIEGKATMPTVLCDGDSTVTVTAQLLDRCDMAVPMEGRLINFHSNDISLLKNPDPSGQQAVITVVTDRFGKAKATFITTDCKSAIADEVIVDVSTMSPSVTTPVPVLVVKPQGFVPDGVNVYTDQNALSVNHPVPETHHAKPYLIAADGMSPTEVTAQVCEWTKKTITRMSEQGMITEEIDFCNPVKRCGMEIQFEIENTHIVENAGDNVYAIEGTHDGNAYPSYVKMLTDAEGKATAIFRSTGDAPNNKNDCTKIKVSGKDGVLFEYEAYAKVCTKGYAGMYPNALWVWAEPAFITADGISHTEVRTALYYCYENFEDWPTWPNWPAMGGLSQAQGVGEHYLYQYCKPVKMPGVTVKFETMNTDALDDGMGGYKIYDITDEFGQAHATFQSKGFDTQHMGPAEIKVFTLGSGEDVKQLNKLVVGLEEKTWPWCPEYSEWFAPGRTTTST